MPIIVTIYSQDPPVDTSEDSVGDRPRGGGEILGADAILAVRPDQRYQVTEGDVADLADVGDQGVHADVKDLGTPAVDQDEGPVGRATGIAVAEPCPIAFSKKKSPS